MRGFVQGIVWGGLAAVGGLVVVSQVAGPVAPIASDPVVVDTAATDPAATDPVATDPVATAPVAAPQPVAEPAPAVPVAQPDAPEPAPEPSSPPAAPTPPPDVAVAAPPVPETPPARPESDPPAEALASAGRVEPVVPPVSGAAPTVPAMPPVALGLPLAEPALGDVDLPPPPAVPDEALLRPLPEQAPAATPEPAPQAVPDPTPEPVPDVTAELAPEATPEPEPTPVPGPDLGPLAQMPSATLAPAPGLTDQASGVVTGRLPRIGLDPAAGATATQDPAPVPDVDLPPRQRYARPFDNQDQKPLFAVLLVDDGAGDVNRADLAALDLPLSIVIDPLSDGAAERAAIWRAGGQEVVMAASGIPDGASPADLEQSLQILATALPETVALIDSTGSSFQNDRPLAAQMVPILAEQGRGLVTFDQGLNAADQEARRNDLPATMIFRRIDADAEDAPVIRRYLDRAAFKAAQDGRVVVIGTLRPETVAGILEWAVEGRASTVALAPISALLQAN